MSDKLKTLDGRFTTQLRFAADCPRVELSGGRGLFLTPEPGKWMPCQPGEPVTPLEWWGADPKDFLFQRNSFGNIVVPECVRERVDSGDRYAEETWVQEVRRLERLDRERQRNGK